MSIATEIERIANAKASIKASIENKGVEVGDGLIDTYASKIDEISTGGSGGGSAEAPSIGITLDKWNDEGYVTEATIIGMTEIPSYYFYGYSSYLSVLNKYLTKVNFPEGVTKLGNNAFYNCDKLNIPELPDTITTIGTACFTACSSLALEKLPSKLTTLEGTAFSGCSSLAIKTIPSTVKTLNNYTFNNCRGIKQISMDGVTKINAVNSSNSPFANCSGLKAVWLGSQITSSTISRYSFSGCTSLLKIFIDKPRSMVQGINGYTYAFMNNNANTGIIVCNDDEGFIDKETFDNTDWSTYTE